MSEGMLREFLGFISAEWNSVSPLYFCSVGHKRCVKPDIYTVFIRKAAFRLPWRYYYALKLMNCRSAERTGKRHIELTERMGRPGEVRSAG
jgi:hypothetical protein